MKPAAAQLSPAIQPVKQRQEDNASRNSNCQTDRTCNRSYQTTVCLNPFLDTGAKSSDDKNPEDKVEEVQHEYSDAEHL